MKTEATKRDILLVALEAAPLDRLRLMKTAFLVWHLGGRPKTGPFDFEPYLYGPCAFDLYTTLNQLAAEGLVVRTPYPEPRWAPYHLTAAGRRQAAAASYGLGDRMAGRIMKIAGWAEKQSFRSLLDYVYKEAPDFAIRSVVR